MRDGLGDGGGKADSASPWAAARNPGARRDMPCSLLKAGREPASASASVLRESPRPAPADADKTEPLSQPRRVRSPGQHRVARRLQAPEEKGSGKTQLFS